MNKQLQKYLKNLPFSLSESAVSMILGALVVILVGLLAYNFFKTRQPAANVSVPPENETIGELTEPTGAVALPTTHTVASGETLWNIAEKYYSSGFNYVDIAKANNISDPGNIEVGTKLTIPKVEIRQPQTINTNLTQTVTPSRIDGNSYTVVAGDNLWEVAVRAYGDGFRWVEIAKANNLVNPGFIHAGNVLSIPR